MNILRIITRKITSIVSSRNNKERGRRERGKTRGSRVRRG